MAPESAFQLLGALWAAERPLCADDPPIAFHVGDFIQENKIEIGKHLPAALESER